MLHKKALYFLTAIWFLLVLVSLWWNQWVVNLVVAPISAGLGGLLIYLDPRNVESKRSGYKLIALVFISFGIVLLAFALFERLLL